ncbi:MAG: hypothetical protein M3Y25_07735 [Thermoproteota archaeon]|nr:hypothetical protein [Thermoproteota archaeon]
MDDQVICFLQKNLPQSDSILVGCRADEDINVHECCEYNIISIDDSYSSKQNLTYCNEFSNGKQNTVFQVRKLSPSELHENQCIQFSNFIYYPGLFLKRIESNHFNQKNQIYRKSFTFRLRKEVFGNVCDLTYLIDSLSKDSVDEGLISFKLKMICLKTLRNYINLYLSKEHRPSHLKYQINSVIQNESLKVRGTIDSILETIGMHRANISTLVRSEKSLELIMRNDQSQTKKLFLNKLNFFKKKSMNVDGMLLIYNYLVDNFQEIEQVVSYKQLLRRTADIDIKSKITLEKEINLLLKINKQLI